MITKWEYVSEKCADQQSYRCEGPIYCHHGRVFWITYPQSRHLTVNIISAKSGDGKPQIIKQSHTPLPSHCFFTKLEDKLFLYTGDLYVFSEDKETFIPIIKLDVKCELYSSLVNDNKLFLLFGREKHYAQLLCFSAEQLCTDWVIDVSALDCPYFPGALSMCDGKLTAFGRGQLLIISPENGEVLESITLPRIGKLYRPIKMQNGDLLIGFTNWNSAGILRMDRQTHKTVWKYSLKFQGPELQGYVKLFQNVALFSKNGTELVAIDAQNGELLYRKRTAPWLYTNPELIGEHLIFGTSGGGGQLSCISIADGNDIWHLDLIDGCEFYANYKGSLLVGDRDGFMRQVDINSGEIMQKHLLDGAVVGQIQTDDKNVYAVTSNVDQDGMVLRLLKIEI